jgi:hypothetical protein
MQGMMGMPTNFPKQRFIRVTSSALAMEKHPLHPHHPHPARGPT